LKKISEMTGCKLCIRKLHISLVIFLTTLLVGITPAQAQEPLPQDLIREVGFEQKLNSQVPLELQFIDSTGQPVHLGDYFNETKPVILDLGYYECPMLCSLVRNALFESLKELEFTVGDEFEVVIVSIDPGETPEIAETKRRASIMSYERSMSDEGWNFLVGEEESIQKLADAVGFQYTYDANIDEYVHPSGIIILTPQGRVSKYIYGIDYPPRDLRLALIEAAEGKIGTPVDQFLLMCYHYDPVEGQYTLFITNIIRMVGVATVVVLGLVLFILLRRERHKNASASSA
jgi:protein SCO1/2